MKDVLFLSNGHGEDDIAAKVVDALCKRGGTPGMIDAWAMVGDGAAYRARGLSLVGSGNQLPSNGFATLDWRLMLRDLRAGWLSTYWRQMRAAVGLAARYRLLVAVGDIVPIAAAALAKSPFVFIGAAKSAYYYDRYYDYNGLERLLLRKFCLNVYPRDDLTAIELRKARVPCRYVGNPMMDALDGVGESFGIETGTRKIAMLAGSRSDAETNILDLLNAAGAAARRADRRLAFVFPAHSGLDTGAVVARLPGDPRLQGWSTTFAEPGRADGVVARLAGPLGAEAIIAKRRFADALRGAAAAVGMAGTANEQAIGLGVPLIAVPSAGAQGERYVRMKMKYFGASAISTPRRDDAIAAALMEVLDNAQLRARMIAAGHERMGDPGASVAIARDIEAFLKSGIPPRLGGVGAGRVA